MSQVGGGDPTEPIPGRGPAAGGEPTAAMPVGATPGGGGQGPDGDRRRALWLGLGGAAALIIIVVIVVLLLSGGSSSNSKSTASTVPASTSTTASSTPATTGVPSGGGGQGGGGASTNPSIVAFNVPGTVTCSSATTVAISWTTKNATQVVISIDGPGPYKTYPGPSGSDSVPFACDGNPHTYMITAQGKGPSATQTVTVHQAAPPSTTSTTKPSVTTTT